MVSPPPFKEKYFHKVDYSLLSYFNHATTKHWRLIDYLYSLSVVIDVFPVFLSTDLYTEDYPLVVC